MMRVLVLLHRWLGIVFCLLFAMWFASGIVMHFVPFPSLTETERVGGLAPIAPADIRHPPSEAVAAAQIENPTRVRLLQRIDGSVYLVSGASGVKAIHAGDLTDATVRSGKTAVAQAADHARRRGLDATHASFAELSAYDQWTVPNRFDVLRPLYRIALNDSGGTEIYVSSVSGEVVLDTTRAERGWNYVGSVVHWIYLTPLRSHWAAWDRTVWWLSLAGMLVALSGVVLGLARIKRKSGWFIGSPYRGWHAWHHILGLVSMAFLLTWIFSGWLSMDHGRLFSRGAPSGAEAEIIAAGAAWRGLPIAGQPPLSTQAKEVEWFVFDRKVFRRERTGPDTQLLSAEDPATRAFLPRQQVLSPGDIGAFVDRLQPGCSAPTIVARDDTYVIESSLLNAPVYRSVCGGSVWFDIDGANGDVLQRLDGSRRAYRWFYTALHTMDFPLFYNHPLSRSALILLLCAGGFVFSLTGVVIGWSRLRLQYHAMRERG